MTTLTPTPTRTQPPAAVPEALRPHDLSTVVAFLLGEAPLDGVEFGKRHPTELGAYWWRKHLRAAINAEAPAEPSPELQRMTAERAAFFLQRFLLEEELLGPNERAAVRFAVAALQSNQAEQPGAARHPTEAEHQALTAAARRGTTLVARGTPAAPMSAQPSDRAAEILAKICDLFHIGKLARDEATILTNVENVIRFTNFLRALERELFPQPELPEDDDPYAEVEKLPAPNSWGAKDEAAYVEQFRAALAARAAAPAPTTEQAGKYGSPQYWVTTAIAELDGVETDDDNNCMKAAKSALRKALAAAPGGEAPADGDARDAARYRLLRLGAYLSVIDGVGDHLSGDALDAAADVVLAAQSQKGAA